MKCLMMAKDLAPEDTIIRDEYNKTAGDLQQYKDNQIFKGIFNNKKGEELGDGNKEVETQNPEENQGKKGCNEND